MGRELSAQSANFPQRFWIATPVNGGLCLVSNLNPPCIYSFSPNISYPLSPATKCRKFVMSRNGGAPNKRLYSRLNCEGLS